MFSRWFPILLPPVEAPTSLIGETTMTEKSFSYFHAHGLVGLNNILDLQMLRHDIAEKQVYQAER